MFVRNLAVVLTGVAVSFSAQAAVDAKAAEELAKKSACMTCHAIDKKVVGPAYKDVAAKYKADKGAAAKLLDKLKKGGKGNWGEVPMPPQAAVKDADLKLMIEWILSTK